MKFTRDEEFDEDLAPNMTPMIDVVFLLIVFFLVAAQLSVGGADDVELPTASEAQTRRRLNPDSVTIEIKWVGGGPVYEVSGKGYTLSGLLRMLEDLVKVAELRRSPPPPIILRADRRVSYEHVQRLMFACAMRGMVMFDFQAQKPEERGP